MMTKICWNGGEKLTELEKVKSTALMISSVRSCLLYLNEQPDYANFDQYLGENSRPFMAVSKECTSFEDFKKRVLLIKESFWYIRNLNAINIDTALKLFKKDNHGIYIEELLQSAHVRSDWMNAIFSRINAILNSMRSVLVIFDAEETVDAFMHHFADQLDRLNILTINTDLDKKEKYITESGVAKTITLTTREMGRGVDYKTSVAVEKNGGVHVIQTFFSLDIKEETQIKGRTARKDNRGSYEMILCYEHLSKLDLPIGSSKSDVTYKKLCGARDSLNKELYSRRDAHVQAANAKQRAMIDFYKGVKFKGFF
ncbi:helicase conserved C-terminal domain containing protein [Culex quinquefasciatus]|uniref:Helicase conserved C-terminal domain containing protein n=1 Tax=Culex quinquefasciatus TaxID=7176 RepID=B0WY60_CULQU|nr:helicase conserved C-terminal domain containing protein [Culex quinquefasciatus]|eukprot:XP_001862332.1 helicase conserved C-terminal domain containing protein [Culex quinquefasciatus]